jgi:hypothetical protein
MNDQASDTFLYIFRSGPESQSMAQMSPEQLQKMMDAWFSWLGDLRSKGIYEAGDPLEEQGKVVRGKNRPTVTDGPYAEGKEEVGGLCDCESARSGARDRAIERLPDP